MRQRLFVIGLSLTGLFAVVGILLPVAMERLAEFDLIAHGLACLDGKHVQ